MLEEGTKHSCLNTNKTLTSVILASTGYTQKCFKNSGQFTTPLAVITKVNFDVQSPKLLQTMENVSPDNTAPPFDELHGLAVNAAGKVMSRMRMELAVSVRLKAPARVRNTDTCPVGRPYGVVPIDSKLVASNVSTIAAIQKSEERRGH